MGRWKFPISKHGAGHGLFRGWFSGFKPPKCYKRLKSIKIQLTQNQWKTFPKIKLPTFFYCYVPGVGYNPMTSIQPKSFILDLYSTSSREYYSEVLPAQSQPKQK